MKWYRAHFDNTFPEPILATTTICSERSKARFVLKQCGDDLSRENIVKQARNIKGLVLPTLIPGIAINTGPDNSITYTQLQL